MVENIYPKYFVFKYQGASRNSHFQDGNVDIRDIELIHIDWNSFLTIFNKKKEQSTMVLAMIKSGLINTTSHLTYV